MTNARQEAAFVEDLTAKGDIIVASAAHTPSTVNVGANNTVLVANSSATSGVNWSSTLSGLTLTSPVDNLPYISSPFETALINSGAPYNGTQTINVITDKTIYYFTSTATNNWTLNITGSSSPVTLASLLSVGQTITLNLLVTQGSTPYYQTGTIQIDGSTTNVTQKWSGGTAPSAGNASGIDIYQFTIIKTATTPAYTVLSAGPIKYA